MMWILVEVEGARDAGEVREAREELMRWLKRHLVRQGQPCFDVTGPERDDEDPEVAQIRCEDEERAQREIWRIDWKRYPIQVEPQHARRVVSVTLRAAT